MACVILYDRTNERAVLFCTTTERPVNHQAFRGFDAFDQASDFLEWMDDDPREYPKHHYTLDQMIDLWKSEAFDDDVFLGHRRVRIVGQIRVHEAGQNRA